MKKIITLKVPDEEWNLINKKTVLKNRHYSRTLCKLQQNKKRNSRRIKGSLTMEAAVAVPVFLLALAHLIIWISFLGTERELTIKVNERARRIAAERSIEMPVGDQRIEIKKGAFLRGRYFTTKAVARAFTGRTYQEIEDDKEGQSLVFITKTGTVYHHSIVCPHIKRVVMACSASEVKEKRNEKGGKYYPCEFCKPGKGEGKVFITEYGHRYHARENCKGLKRQIRLIRKKMAGEAGFTPCKKCGGTND